MGLKKLSIIIPVYNEENTIKMILSKLEALDLGIIEKEIVIVDDGSRDGTREILKGYEQKHRIIYHQKNFGKGAAVRTGYRHALGDCLIIQDADLEYEPEDIKIILEYALKNNADVVYGSRRLESANKKNPAAGWHYYWGGVFLSVLANLLYGTKITDEPTGYKMVSRDVLARIDLVANGFEFCPEITAKIARLGIQIHEVPISYKPRSKNEGKKIKLKDGLIAIWTLIKYRFKK